MLSLYYQLPSEKEHDILPATANIRPTSLGDEVGAAPTLDSTYDK